MRILVAITGASGIIYGKRLVEVLKELGQDVSVIVSEGAKKVSEAELESLPKSDYPETTKKLSQSIQNQSLKTSAKDRKNLVGSVYSENDLSAPFASGSNAADAMIVCPCSLKTLGEIANGVGSNLISRAAEVCLKERKKLILVPRETPYSYITIKNMETITLAGGIILPASPGFYHSPKKIEDLVNFIVGKILDQLEIKNSLFKRWNGE